MCDPLSLGLTALGAVGSVGSSMAQNKAANKQANEVAQWTQQQKKFRQAEQGRQEELREGATEAQQQGLDAISAENQKKRQDEEQARLADYLEGESAASNVSGEAPVAEADKAMLSGQDTGEPEFKTDLAKKINEASKSAKKRIGALATIGSYGDSFGGLATTNPILQAEAGSAIDRQNEFRRGSLGAYNVERAIDPVQVTYTPSPMAGVFDAALSLGTSGIGNVAGGGKGFGDLFKGGFAKDALTTFPKVDLFSKSAIAQPLTKKFTGSKYYGSLF
jgi:hypothetical protein